MAKRRGVTVREFTEAYAEVYHNVVGPGPSGSIDEAARLLVRSVVDVMFRAPFGRGPLAAGWGRQGDRD